MAALTVTAANVGVKETGVSLEVVPCGETFTQGQPLYKKSSDNLWYKADSNASSATADAKGVALTPGAASGYAVIVKAGKYNPGATVTVGQIYCVGATAGEIVPYADLTTGDYVTYLGVGSTSSEITLAIKATGVVKP